MTANVRDASLAYRTYQTHSTLKNKLHNIYIAFVNITFISNKSDGEKVQGKIPC